MRGVSRAKAVSLLVAATGVLLVTEASAGTLTFSSPARSDLSLNASDGYSVTVERIGRKVSLTAFRQQGKAFAFASYTVRGRASQTRIEASFGKLGRVSVKLKTKRVKRSSPGKGCAGKVAITRFGVFVGRIRFRGEGGYTTVDARRAHGQASSAIRETCPFPLSQSQPSARTSAARRHPPELIASLGRRLGFVAQAPSRSTGLKSIVFEAGASERRGRIDIFRAVSTVGGPAGYAFAQDLSSATVRPPSPFGGEATFRRERRGSASWLGTLSVSFPGREDVRLTGPRFSAKLRPFER